MKKIIKQLFMLGALVALLPIGAGAQTTDARQRTTETVIADGLAQLPAADVAVFNQVMAEFAATGSPGVQAIASMLVPADKGKNATVEYALSGIVAYVTAPGNEALVPGVRKGLLGALKHCTDKTNQAFLLSQLRLCMTAEDADAVVTYLDDPYFSDYAIRVLLSTPGTEPILLTLAAKQDLTAERKQALAYAFGEKQTIEAEPMLLQWLSEADTELAATIYHSLAVCGSRASLKPLSVAAAKIDYGCDRLGATDAYLRLLAKLAKTGDTQALKAAKTLLKTDRQYVRGAALDIVVGSEGVQKAMPYILSAIKEGPAQYRYAALQTLGTGDDKLFAQIAAGMTRYTAEARAAVITWLGERGAVSLSGVVISFVTSSNDDLALAAIEASGRIGGQRALTALIDALQGPHAEAATKALLAFNGRINPEVESLLAGNDRKSLVPALALAASRRMATVADRVFALLDNSDVQVRTAAYEALPYVTEPQSMGRLAALLDSADEQYISQIQTALIRICGKLPAGKRYDAIARYMQASKVPARYYPVVATTGTPEALANLQDGFRKGDTEAAFAAMLTVDSPAMIDILYRIAADNTALADRALMRYADLVAKAEMTPIRRYQLYRMGLELDPSETVRRKLLGYLSGVHTIPALMLAAEYMADDGTAEAAAQAVKTIVAKSSPMPGGAMVRSVLEKAREIYRQKTLTVTDAGYTVDEITELLGKIPATGFDVLPTNTLTGWVAVASDASGKKNLSDRQLSLLEKSAKEAMTANWHVVNGVLVYDGHAPSTIGTEKEYENFELWVESRSKGGSGVAVRSGPQLWTGSTRGTGWGLETATPDTKVGKNVDCLDSEWETRYIKVVDDRITMYVDGVKVFENAMLNPPGEMVYNCGRIELLGAGQRAEFRDLYINELPSTPVFELSAGEKAQGYEVLFDGRSLQKWTGNTVNYVPLDGTIDVTASYGGSGNLYTVKEYSDFDLRFEFRFLTEGVNNGIGIRTPMGMDAAYHGMEIQILDHDAPIYKNLKEYQQHGSVYGIIPAERIVFGELGTWNTMEIRAVGDRITVTVNGRVILDGDIRDACQGHHVSEDGSKTNPYTVDHRNHPGLFNKKGHIGLLGHGTGIQFRNMRVLDLSKQSGRK